MHTEFVQVLGDKTALAEELSKRGITAPKSTTVSLCIRVYVHVYAHCLCICACVRTLSMSIYTLREYDCYMFCVQTMNQTSVWPCLATPRVRPGGEISRVVPGHKWRNLYYGPANPWSGCSRARRVRRGCSTSACARSSSSSRASMHNMCLN